jgi:ornithine carbamoyltransferase
MTAATDRDLLALDDLDSSDVLVILRRARDLARDWSDHRMPQSLSGKRIALVVNDGGWRNTTAFDLGVQSMGGLCVHTPMRLDQREAIGDLAHYLDNWIDAVVSRAPELAALLPKHRRSTPERDRITRAIRLATRHSTSIGTAKLMGSRSRLLLLMQTSLVRGEKPHALSR